MQKLKKKGKVWWAFVPLQTGGEGWLPAPDICFATRNEMGLPGQDGDECRTCAFKEPCFTDLVLVTIPALEKQGHKTPAELAAQLGVLEPSVIYALDQRGKVDRPTMAESAGPATDLASPSRAKRNKNAPRVKAQDVHKVSWSPKFDKARWLRERENTPEIAALTPGTVLRRQYRGVDYEVKVLKGAYEYGGFTWPTLYAVTKEITGTHAAPRQLEKAGRPGTRPEGTRNLCNWSALKFWKLGRYAPQPPRRRKLKDPRRPK